MCLGKSPLLFVIVNKGDFCIGYFFYIFRYQFVNLGGIESVMDNNFSLFRTIQFNGNLYFCSRLAKWVKF